MLQRILLFLGILLLLIPVLAGARYARRIIGVTTFEECASAGFTVQESIVRSCRAGWKSFTESVPEEVEEGNIRVTSPRSGDIASFPLTLKGEARVFEGTVRYRLRDADETILVDGFTTAEVSETVDFSAFSADITYPQPSGRQGTLEVFEESALDGGEASLVTVPVRF
ncbi:MAG: Gmad2 immunoglobulin-like domain-containing protein [Patescibacteria group bacterium]